MAGTRCDDVPKENRMDEHGEPMGLTGRRLSAPRSHAQPAYAAAQRTVTMRAGGKFAQTIRLSQATNAESPSG